MASLYKVGSHKTKVSTSDGATRVTYHSTDVVTFTGETVTLNSGDWRSQTTKTRMNQASNQYGLGFQVYQDNWDWFVTLPNGETVPFSDGMTFSR